MEETAKTLDPNKIKIGDIILVAGDNRAVINIQKKLGYGKSSKWTHVAGSIGGYDLVEGWIPQSVVSNLQKKYVDKGIEIKVMRKNWVKDYDRIKVALWWATMNNVPYDYLQLLRFPIVANGLLFLRDLFNSKKRFICSELITDGFYPPLISHPLISAKSNRGCRSKSKQGGLRNPYGSAS